MKQLKLTAIGNSTGVTLPKETLARLNLVRGDTVFLTETPNGVLLSPYDEEFERQVKIVRRVMRRHRNALRDLAK